MFSLRCVAWLTEISVISAFIGISHVPRVSWDEKVLMLMAAAGLTINAIFTLREIADRAKVFDFDRPPSK